MLAGAALSEGQAALEIRLSISTGFICHCEVYTRSTLEIYFQVGSFQRPTQRASPKAKFGPRAHSFGEGKAMAYNNSISTSRKFRYQSLLLATLLTAVTLVSAQEQGPDKNATETIDATAMGTSTQLGKTVSVKIIITRYTTEEERQGFIAAFKKGQNQGLVDALSKAKSVGRIAITGTLGTQLSYVRVVPTPTGRRIRFATDRPIRIGEAMNAGPSTAYNLTAGEIDFNDSDKKKSAGVLYPASQLIINKKGELQFELRRNPWNLVNIIDWNKAGSEAQ
jgi:hypothetical protein